MFSDINCSSIFFNSSPRVIKIKINKWDLIKFKSLWKAKEPINETKGQSEEWEKIFANGEVNNELVTKICKEHMWLNTIKTHNPIKNGQKIQIDISLKKSYRWLRGTSKDAQHC